MHLTGPILAAVTFGTIAAGHHLVRFANYHFGTKPAVPLMIVGAALTAASVWIPDRLGSAVVAMVGITTIVDGIEVIRQEKRVLRGHAPKNPARFPDG